MIKNHSCLQYMSFATIKGEIAEVNVGLNQVVKQRFTQHNFHLGNYFKTGLSFVGLTWLVIGNSKDIVPNQTYVESCDLPDEFPQLIVISFIHYQYNFSSIAQLKCINQLVYALVLHLML